MSNQDVRGAHPSDPAEGAPGNENGHPLDDEGVERGDAEDSSGTPLTQTERDVSHPLQERSADH